LYDGGSPTAATTNFHNYGRTPHHDNNYDRTTGRASIFEHNHDNCGYAASIVANSEKAAAVG
jgi:hypothetical protein